jgi:hypothetical protein
VSTDQTPYRMILAHHRSLWRFARQTTRGPHRLLLPFVAAGLGVRTLLAWGHRAGAGWRGHRPRRTGGRGEARWREARSACRSPAQGHD